MKHKGQAVWLQQREQHQSVLFLPVSLRTEAALWPVTTFAKVDMWRLWWRWRRRPHNCCRWGAFHCLCGIRFWALKEDAVWSAPSSCFVLAPPTSREYRTAPSVSPEQNIWGWRTCCSSLKLRKETGFRFWKPSGMRMGKPVWATGISSKRQSTARVQGLHRRSVDPVFVIRNATEKVSIVHSLTHFFVLLVLWFTYKGSGSPTSSNWSPKMPTRVQDNAFSVHDSLPPPNGLIVFDFGKLFRVYWPSVLSLGFVVCFYFLSMLLVFFHSPVHPFL